MNEMNKTDSLKALHRVLARHFIGLTQEDIKNLTWLFVDLVLYMNTNE